MKKIITLSFICSFLSLKAQVTITAADMPSIGDTIRYSDGIAGFLDFKTKGANYKWDYSKMGFTGQGIYKYQALFSTPYATLAFSGMPAQSIGVKAADSIGQGQASIKNVYNFYQKKTTAPSGWFGVGTGFTLAALPLPAGSAYSDKDEIFSFPLNYNDQDSTTFQVTTPLGPALFPLGSYKQKGYRINKVEGWGTISTPYGNAISCLKIKSTIIETDSLKVSSASLNVGFQNNRVEYKWLSKTEKIPVLEVTGTEIAGIFTPTIIRFRDNYRAAQPSPFSPKVKFSADKMTGVKSTDTFKLINSTTPAFGTTYLWSITPSAGVRFVKSTTNTSSNPYLVFDNAGVYTVKLSATNLTGTRDSTAINMLTVTSGSGIKEINANSVFFYPNPVKAAFQFTDAKFENKICRIFDLTGKLVLEELIPVSLLINCEALAKGTYTVVVADSETLYYQQMVRE